jgi:hypothetical protein
VEVSRDPLDLRQPREDRVEERLRREVEETVAGEVAARDQQGDRAVARM